MLFLMFISELSDATFMNIRFYFANMKSVEYISTMFHHYINLWSFSYIACFSVLNFLQNTPIKFDI